MSRSRIAVFATAAMLGFGRFDTLSTEDTTSCVTSGSCKERGGTDDVERLRRVELRQYCFQLVPETIIPFPAILLALSAFIPE